MIRFRRRQQAGYALIFMVLGLMGVGGVVNSVDNSAACSGGRYAKYPRHRSSSRRSLV